MCIRTVNPGHSLEIHIKGISCVIPSHIISYSDKLLVKVEIRMRILLHTKFDNFTVVILFVYGTRRSVRTLPLVRNPISKGDCFRKLSQNF